MGLAVWQDVTDILGGNEEIAYVHERAAAVAVIGREHEHLARRVTSAISAVEVSM